jgi:hypothetical protein
LAINVNEAGSDGIRSFALWTIDDASTSDPIECHHRLPLFPAIFSALRNRRRSWTWPPLPQSTLFPDVCRQRWHLRFAPLCRTHESVAGCETEQLCEAIEPSEDPEKHEVIGLKVYLYLILYLFCDLENV